MKYPLRLEPIDDSSGNAVAYWKVTKGERLLGQFSTASTMNLFMERHKDPRRVEHNLQLKLPKDYTVLQVDMCALPHAAKRAFMDRVENIHQYEMPMDLGDEREDAPTDHYIVVRGSASRINDIVCEIQQTHPAFHPLLALVLDTSEVSSASSLTIDEQFRRDYGY